MPGKNRTGPNNQGHGKGRGRDVQKGLKRGRMGSNSPGSGPNGYCICPSCGEKLPHEQGSVCNLIKCPNCSNTMIRE